MDWTAIAKVALLAFLAFGVLTILVTYVRRRRHIRPTPLDPHIAVIAGRGVWAPTPRPPWADEFEAEEAKRAEESGKDD